MCKWGTTVTLKNLDPEAIHHKIISIDSCIASIIQALMQAGVYTLASCCGHGKQPGSIILVDGREIRIYSNSKIARKIDILFPPIN